MPRVEIKVGDKFASWTILEQAKSRGAGLTNHYYLCKCECGKEREVYRGSLVMLRSKSCGCKPNVRNEQ